MKILKDIKMNKSIRIPKLNNLNQFYIIDDTPYAHHYENEPIGGGNPYYCCSSCGISDPQINGSLAGHAEDCEWKNSKIKQLIKEKYGIDVDNQ